MHSIKQTQPNLLFSIALNCTRNNLPEFVFSAQGNSIAQYNKLNKFTEL